MTDPRATLPATRSPRDAASRKGAAEPTETMLAAGLEPLLGYLNEEVERSEDCLRLIYRAMATAAPADWQPIESAPRDGTAILAIGFRTEPRVVSWRLDWGWSTKPGNYRFGPTRWMPLPEPPESGT